MIKGEEGEEEQEEQEQGRGGDLYNKCNFDRGRESLSGCC